MGFLTRSQSTMTLGLSGLLLLGIIAMGVADVFATVACSPQAGKWTPWTGVICYGESRQ